MNFTNTLKIYLLLLFALLANSISAQNKKAIKAYESAREALRNDDYEACWIEIEKALKFDENYFDALVFAGDFKMNEDQPGAAIPYYERALRVRNVSFLKYRTAIACRDNLQYSKALQYAKQYQSEATIPADKLDEFDLFMESLYFGEEAMKSPVTFEPIDLGPSINTEAMEYFPSINAQGDVLVYTSRMTTGNKQDEDFFVSILKDSTWQPGERLQGYLNSADNEGAQSLSADGTELYFAGCQRMDGYGSCDIYVSFLVNGLWTKPRNLGREVNSGNWESQPSISPDGKTLYFVRSRAGDNTNSNIMTSQRQADGSWSRATPIGAPINTPFADESPYIHFDNRTLFFVSEGHPGMGRKDLFYSKKQPDGSWGEPVNLGYAINTPQNEYSLVVGPDGRTAYFASDRISGGFNLDIYTFTLPETKSATPIAWVLGRIEDEETQKPLETTIEFFDLVEKKTFQEITSDENGKFFAVMPTDRMFGVFINKKGYLPYSQNYDLAGVDNAENFEVTIGLKPLKVGSSFVLNNILFDTDQFELKPESYDELDKLVAFLTENATLKAEIQGHTDNEGSEAYNKTLSLNRAKAVVNYLTSKGIDKKRLTYVGLGQSQPIADNSTAAGRKQNRRTSVLLK